MIKISALNTDSSSSSDGDDDTPKITKEAQEEITLSKYNKALEYQRNGKLDAALYVMREIIMNELPKLADKEGLPTKFLKLNYACHRNVAIMFYEKNHKSIALDYYLDAAEIDGTDVSLWFRIGTIAIELEDYNLAVQAFQKGLDCNPKHWPCLDKVIMLFYALREDISCLYYISKAFILDPSYLRGLALRHQIYRYNTAIQDYFQALYQTSETDPPLDAPFDTIEGAKLIEESESIAQKINEQQKANEKPSVPPSIPLNKPLEEYTWLAVGRSLLAMYEYIDADDNLVIILLL